MIFRIIILLFAGTGLVSCTGKDNARTSEKEMEVLYIYPDGRYEFEGRSMNKEDVVIYKDGRGGERAAVKLIIPRHPDVYRDTITVKRVDVPVKHKVDSD